MADEKKWLTVRETAARLNRSEEMVRRMIRAGELPASRLSAAAKAPWMIDADELERQLKVHAERTAVRMRLDRAGVTVGRSVDSPPQGGGVVIGRGEDFYAEIERAYPGVKVGGPEGPPLADYLRQRDSRAELFDRIEREMYADPAVRQRFEKLDEEARFEEEARELARRIRRAERLRERALEILDEDEAD
jgi:Helix-turn-helix domain